ncbi:MAG: A24 family peptidase [Microbacteriaceae bacterium]|nr:A24 family peptidase [Microbacteriaceae bacterium]
MVDLAERRIPNVVALPASGAVFVLRAASALLDGEWPRVLGAVIGAAVLFALYVVLAFISPRGMGMGDVNLAILVGAVTGYLGLSSWLIGMLAGFVIGAVISLIGLLIGRATRSTLIPFGPSMVAGALLAIALS